MGTGRRREPDHTVFRDHRVGAGLDRRAILRSRVFVTDISQAEHVGLAHRAFFGGLIPSHTPALTQVEVSALIAPEFVVEIECDAHA